MRRNLIGQGEGVISISEIEVREVYFFSEKEIEITIRVGKVVAAVVAAAIFSIAPAIARGFRRYR